jgi:hypothetical protein
MAGPQWQQWPLFQVPAAVVMHLAVLPPKAEGNAGMQRLGKWMWAQGVQAARPAVSASIIAEHLGRTTTQDATCATSLHASVPCPCSYFTAGLHHRQDPPAEPVRPPG